MGFHLRNLKILVVFILFSLSAFSQADNPISPDEARRMVLDRYAESFDLGEKVFSIEKFEFISDARTLQLSCPKLTRKPTGNDWFVKENFVDYLECIKPHFNRVYSVAKKFREAEEAPFTDDNESIMLDGTVLKGQRREAELAYAMDMVIEVYSTVFPFLEGFGGSYDEKTDSDEYYILDDTLKVGNNVRLNWLVEELHKKPGRAGPLCDGLIQVFEDNFVPIESLDYISAVMDALTFMYEHPTEVKWEVYAGAIVVTATVIYFSPVIVPAAASMARVYLSRKAIIELLKNGGQALKRQLDNLIDAIDKISPAARERAKLFEEGKIPKASDLVKYAEKQKWTPARKGNGPLKYFDKNGVERMVIKKGSPQTPGSEGPHIALKNARGKRIDPFGNKVQRRGDGNHFKIEYDLP